MDEMMKKRSVSKFLTMLLLLAQLFSLTAGVTAFAATPGDVIQLEPTPTPVVTPEPTPELTPPPASELVELPKPYARRNCSDYKLIFMGSEDYDEGMEFQMGYTGYSNGDSAQATYNLDGKYSLITFDAGYIGGAGRNAVLTVYGDGNVLLDETTLQHQDEPRTFTVNAEGVRQLKLIYKSSGYDKTNYGIGNVRGVRVADLDTTIYVSDLNYDVPRAKLSGSLISDGFEMGGRTYVNGYAFNMGYVSGSSKSVTFDFNGQYEETAQ